MKHVLVFASICAVVLGQTGVTMPTWVAPYPGTAPDTRTQPSLVESTYQTKAKPAAVVEHYGKLFETAGLPFAPAFDGVGSVIRASAPECNLMIKIREQDGGAFVRVSCAVKTPTMVAVATSSPTAAPTRPPARDAVHDADDAARNRLLEMRKYDEPVAARPRTTPTWPAWLVDPQGGKLPVRRTAADSTFLATSFSVAAEPTAVQSFYSDLVESHGCTVTGRGKSWLESSCPVSSVKQLIIRAELAPAPGGTTVQLRVSSIP
jgi:hypothetical protein